MFSKTLAVGSRLLLISSSPLCVVLVCLQRNGPRQAAVPRPWWLGNNAARVCLTIIFSVIFSAQRACWSSRSDGRLRRVGLGSYGPAAGLAAPAPSQSTIRLCVCVCHLSVRPSVTILNRSSPNFARLCYVFFITCHCLLLYLFVCLGNMYGVCA